MNSRLAYFLYCILSLLIKRSSLLCILTSVFQINKIEYTESVDSMRSLSMQDVPNTRVVKNLRWFYKLKAVKLFIMVYHS